MTLRHDRFHSIEESKSQDPRTPGRRDRDRILYSSAFRRLAGITQVISATDRFPIHNRLTHSLEVAQIGRSLAEKFQSDDQYAELFKSFDGLDPEVVEAACLAHDLGHPPFGHVAEEELDRLVLEEEENPQGFEGNPQSFRVVTKLATRRQNLEGLNLTRATLDAMLKYPWLRDTAGDEPQKKWGAYDSERAEFEFARELRSDDHLEARSLEAELMDWADDVAYAVHDVEDFYRAGIVPLGKLASNPNEQAAFIEASLKRDEKLRAYDAEDLGRAFNRIFGYAPIPDPFTGNRQDRALLKTVTSSLIDGYINAALLKVHSDGSVTLTVDDRARMEVTLLKGLTWHYVIESRALITQRYGQKNLIRSLFKTLCNASEKEKDRRIFPEFYRESMENDASNDQVIRSVADFISSMTESQVVDMHHRLTGTSLGAALDPIVP